MSLGYKLITRKVSDLKGGAKKDKIYAIPSYNGFTDMGTLCRLIEMRSAISSADVKAVLDNLNMILDLELQAGRIVQLGELGNFRLSLSSDGTDEGKKFTHTDIRKARVIFTPGASLRKTRNTISFVSVVKNEGEGGGTPKPDPDENPDDL